MSQSLLDPEGNLHHTSRDVPITPQRLHCLVIVSWTGRLVEKWTPCIFVFADELDLFQRVLWLPFLNLWPNLTNSSLGRTWHRKHTQCCEDLDFWNVILISFCNLCSTFLDEATLFIPDFTVWCSVLSEDH